MKRPILTMLITVAGLALATNLALADCGKCDAGAQPDAEHAALHECCAKALEEGKGCCGMTAEQLRAANEKGACPHKAHAEEAHHELHECCAKALKEGKGCCGKTAEELEAAAKKAGCPHKAQAE